MSRVPWNKGKKGLQISWLKGLTKETDIRVARLSKDRSQYMLSDKNQFRGKHQSTEHKQRIGISNKGIAKTATPTYRTLHCRLISKYGKSNCCQNPKCEQTSMTFDYALKHGHSYSDSIDDYISLCRQCHSLYDGQGQKSWITRNNNNKKQNGKNKNSKHYKKADAFKISGRPILHVNNCP